MSDQIEVELASHQGNMRVQGHPIKGGLFAATPSYTNPKRGRWNVTHIPTGSAVMRSPEYGKGLSLAAAKRVAMKLQQVMKDLGVLEVFEKDRHKDGTGVAAVNNELSFATRSELHKAVQALYASEGVTP